MPNTIFPAAEGAVLSRIADSQMLARINEHDWSETFLGPIARWPESLKSAVRLILASSIPMSLMLGRDGLLLYNDAYIDVAGERHPSCLGASVFACWPELEEFNRAVFDRVMAGESPSFENQELTLLRGGREKTVWMDLDFSPLLGVDGRAMGVFAIVFETTRRVQTERALARSEERLSLALDAAGAVGVWDWNISTNSVTADERFAEMFGVDVVEAANGTPIERFLEAIHPDDRELVGASITAALGERRNYRAEYRLHKRNGVQRWVLALGRVIPDPFGKPHRLPGIAIDITERKAQEEQLAESEARFRVLADTMPQMVWSTRPDGFHDYYNARWYEFTGVPEGSTDGAEWNGMFHPDDRERAWELWRHSLATGEPYQVEYRLRHHSGDYRWTLGRALPVRDRAGRIMRWFGTCTDIHETKLAAEEREIVAQELSHRIKNIFSVLNGIIALSARAYPQAAGFAGELRGRIASMGKAHDFVRPHSRESRPYPNEATLAGLVEQLLAPYRSDQKERIRISSDNIAIDDASATPLALLFHELATNSAKYGGLSVPEGQVSVAARLERENCRVTWKENAPNLAPTPGPDGFGARLISLSVEGQLGGWLERFWEPDGLRVEIGIPSRSLTRANRRTRETTVPGR